MHFGTPNKCMPLKMKLLLVHYRGTELQVPCNTVFFHAVDKATAGGSD